MSFFGKKLKLSIYKEPKSQKLNHIFTSYTLLYIWDSQVKQNKKDNHKNPKILGIYIDTQIHKSLKNRQGPQLQNQPPFFHSPRVKCVNSTSSSLIARPFSKITNPAPPNKPTAREASTQKSPHDSEYSYSSRSHNSIYSKEMTIIPLIKYLKTESKKLFFFSPQ